MGAIAITLGDMEQRRDIPVLDASFESPQVPGLFLAGELTGFALVRTAIAHGTAVASEVARKVESEGRHDGDLDLCIVGAGPAGLACSLEAKRHGLRSVVLEQEELGGAVAKYPRRKLVMTQPVELPLYGNLSRSSYSKEELIGIWEEIALREELPIHTGERMTAVERLSDGSFRVRTQAASWEARNVCLALGRRGTPRKLGVPGEELPKVAYSLLDAQSYQGRRVLVVGGGDSAVEAALGLAEQPGNEVVLSYRKKAFNRIKARNEVRLNEALQSSALSVLTESEVLRITPDEVLLQVVGEGEPRQVRLGNDEVFVFAGGIPPFELLESFGVSFDPGDRPESEPLAEQGTGLVPALLVALVWALLALAWSLYHAGYYALPLSQRPGTVEHALLRPSGTLGLAFGIVATVLIATNLAYLLRRSPRIPLTFGSLQTWMTSHLVTGLMALVLTLIHCGLVPRDTPGGHALVALVVLVVTGAIGRYFYAFVPRAANGRELALEDVRLELASLAAGWERTNRDFGERVRKRIDGLISSGRWQGGFFVRLAALLSSQGKLRSTLREIEAEGRAEGIAADQLRELVRLGRRAHHTSLMAAHYGDLRAVMGSWRYFHRWIALLMVLLLIVHIVVALRYGSLGGERS